MVYVVLVYCMYNKEVYVFLCYGRRAPIGPKLGKPQLNPLIFPFISKIGSPEKHFEGKYLFLGLQGAVINCEKSIPP